MRPRIYHRVVSVRLRELVIRCLGEYAQAHGLSVSEVIRRAIEEYIGVR